LAARAAVFASYLDRKRGDGDELVEAEEEVLHGEGGVEELGSQVECAVINIVGCCIWDVNLGGLSPIPDLGEGRVSPEEMGGCGMSE
jgi:hypothetical protein